MVILALLAALIQNPPTASTGGVQGVVVRAGTAEPLSKASIELRGDDDRASPIVSTTTDSDGGFVFRALRPGRYRLMTSRAGYVRRSASVTVSGGRIEDLTVPLTATAAIGGRVTSQTGEGLGNVAISALRASYQNGRRTFTSVQTVRSDDRGDYRLFWLPPGRYFVRATHPSAETGEMAMIGGGAPMGASFEMFSISIGGPSPNGVFAFRGTGDPTVFDAFGIRDPNTVWDRYVPVYFPGTSDGEQASVIDVRAGAEAAGIDLRVAPVHDRHVRGVVVNGATGQVTQYAGLREATDDDLSASSRMPGGLSNHGRAPIEPDGSFDVTLLPGRHTLVGTAGTGTGYVTVDVREADIDGLRIVAAPEFDLQGRIVADNGAAVDMSGIRISLRRELPVPMRSQSYSNPRADGTYVVSATPGDYRVSVAPLLDLTPMPPGFALPIPKPLETAYVKSIRIGDVDVLNNGVHLESAIAAPLEIVIGMSLGALDGAVVRAAGPAPAGITAVLLPDIRRRFDLSRLATTDPTGRFHMDRVAPGDYKLFAWEDAPDGAWQDPDFVRTFEERGTPVHIVEGQTERATATLMSSQ